MSDFNKNTVDEVLNYVRPPKVCLCKSVTKEQIINSIHRGNHTLEAIAIDTLATTGCGTCKPQVQKILEDTLNS
ncbi:MAG: (2Fe-2S)-binding protein [Spirochaetia bacterium]|nr:(2Fe-2S)-binding protein [Spirochaetia bacterium]